MQVRCIGKDRRQTGLGVRHEADARVERVRQHIAKARQEFAWLDCAWAA